MIRKTLTIFFLLGLLISVGLWGVSPWNVQIIFPDGRHEGIGVSVISISSGMMIFCYDQEAYQTWGNSTTDKYVEFKGCRLRVDGTNWYTGWIPWIGLDPITNLIHCGIPFWIPALCFFAVVLRLSRPLDHHRRRKRKMLGLCVKCGYDLRASKDRCPECGMLFRK